LLGVKSRKGLSWSVWDQDYITRWNYHGNRVFENEGWWNVLWKKCICVHGKNYESCWI